MVMTLNYFSTLSKKNRDLAARLLHHFLYEYFNVLLHSDLYFSNCIYVEAREVESKFDWVGSKNTLAYPLNASDINSIWAVGISTKIGYVTKRMSILYSFYMASFIRVTNRLLDKF